MTGNDTSENYVNWFRHSSPYIHQHRNKIVVVMLPGEFIATDHLSNIISDLAVMVSLGLKIVIVHGARMQIDAALASKNLESEFHRDIRVTPHDQLSEIIAAVGQVRFHIEAAASSGLPNSAMHGSRLRLRSGNFVYAKPRGILDGIDYQFTGEVRNVDDESILSELDDSAIVLVSPVGYSLTGEMFNLSFSDVAVSVATAIQADKLITYNDDGQIRDASDHAYREMTLLQCKKFLVETQRHKQNNTYFSLQACHRACDGGVSRAHIISAAEDGAILKELFTRDGSGTMIYRDSYETIRRARIEDVAGILSLIEPLEVEGALVKRSRELLENEVDYFTVMEKDNLIIGVAALYPAHESGFGEIACVAVDQDYRGVGRAKKLLIHLERQASRMGVRTLFVLTTRTAHWFLEQGFTESLVEALPVEKRALYNMQRRSKVFTKRVSARASTIDLS